MTLAFAVLSAHQSRRCLVRAFRSGVVSNVGSLRSASAPLATTPFTTATSASLSATTTPTSTSYASTALYSTRRFSAATDTDTDNELETALEELLGDAMTEASNPTLEGNMAKGHVEGSREFPGGLVEVVSSVSFVVDYIELN